MGHNSLLFCGTATPAENEMDWFTAYLKSHEAALSQGLWTLASAALTLVVGLYALRLVNRVLERLLKARRLDSAVTAFITNLVYYSLLVLVIVSALAQLGVETSTFAAGIAAAGLAIGLALQGSLSHLASGVLIVTFRPFRAGDFIEAGGVAGTVRAIYIFSTELVTADNKVVVVPNGQITGSPIINYSREARRRVELTVGVSYGCDLRRVRSLIDQVVRDHPKVLAEPAPVVGVMALADSSVQLVVRPWCKTDDYWTVHFELNEQIKVALDDAGIEIPFPQLELHVAERTLAVLTRKEEL